jgi:hypothetical protein
MVMQQGGGIIRLGFDRNSSSLPVITEQTYNFLQLEPEVENRVRELNKSLVEDLVSWELANLQDTKNEGGSVSVELPALTKEDLDLHSRYIERLRDIVDESKFEMLDNSMGDALRRVSNARKVTVEIGNKNGTKNYTLRTEFYDAEGKRMGTTSNSGNSLRIERYEHIFGKDL